MNGIGKRLRKLRSERGHTLEDVSTALGVTKSYISDIELGKRSPWPQVDALSEFYGLPAEDLMSGAMCPTCGAEW